MPRHFAFVAPTALPGAPRSIVPPARVTATASAADAAPRLSRRSQSSLHLDWIRNGVPAPAAPAAAPVGRAGPSAAERWGEEMRTPRAQPAAPAAPPAPTGPSAADRWVEQMAAQHAAVAASMMAMKATAKRAPPAALTQTQRAYYDRMNKFATTHLVSDGAAEAGAVEGAVGAGEVQAAKPKPAGVSSYVPAYNQAYIPSYTPRGSAFYVPSFKPYTSASAVAKTAAPAASTEAVKVSGGETVDAAASTSAVEGETAPIRMGQAQYAARMARLTRLARSKSSAAAVSETTAADGKPVYSDAQARWARLSEHAHGVGRASLDGAVEKVSASDLEVRAQEAREREADAEMARELANRMRQVQNGGGRQVVRGDSGFANFAAANGAAAMSPMSIAAVAGMGSNGGEALSEEDALAQTQQTFVSSTIIALFMAVCLICGDRFGDLVQFATGQGMFM